MDFLTIAEAVEKVTGISYIQMQEETRKKEVVKARHFAMYFARKYLKLTQEIIGRAYGSKDHATVLHGCRRVSLEKDRYKEFWYEYQQIDNKLWIDNDIPELKLDVEMCNNCIQL